MEHSWNAPAHAIRCMDRRIDLLYPTTSGLTKFRSPYIPCMYVERSTNHHCVIGNRLSKILKFTNFCRKNNPSLRRHQHYTTNQYLAYDSGSRQLSPTCKGILDLTSPATVLRDNYHGSILGLLIQIFDESLYPKSIGLCQHDRLNRAGIWQRPTSTTSLSFTWKKWMV